MSEPDFGRLDSAEDRMKCSERVRDCPVFCVALLPWMRFFFAGSGSRAHAYMKNVFGRDSGGSYGGLQAKDALFGPLSSV